MSGSFVRLVHSHDHRREERGLRASQVVRAICIQDGAVMFDFEKEILNHAPCQIDSPITQQAQNDEVAVPTIHFVESAAWDYVLVLEVKQAGSDLPRVDLTRCSDDRGKRPHLKFASPLKILHSRGGGKVSRQ